jgi:hypothetical protein
MLKNKHKHGRIESVSPAYGTQATSRIAVFDLDWSKVKAADVYALVSSFLPRDGKLLKVTVYQSNYSFKTDYRSERSRKSSRRRNYLQSHRSLNSNQRIAVYPQYSSKRFYAIIDFDNKFTASIVQSACEGLSFDRTTNYLVLKFVPHNIHFGDCEVRDIAIELSSDYRSPFSPSRIYARTDFETPVTLRRTHILWPFGKFFRRKATLENYNDTDFSECLTSGSEDSLVELTNACRKHCVKLSRKFDGKDPQIKNTV